MAFFASRKSRRGPMPQGPQLTAKMVKASLVLFPAQNISVYTISLANVSDSLDATMASKCCRREVCEFGWSWRDGCSNGSRSRFL